MFNFLQLLFLAIGCLSEPVIVDVGKNFWLECCSQNPHISINGCTWSRRFTTASCTTSTIEDYAECPALDFSRSTPRNRIRIEKGYVP